ncbi:MAG: hypothetical protein WBA57_05155 [Elainellaceae cyanobacterium]
MHPCSISGFYADAAHGGNGSGVTVPAFQAQRYYASVSSPAFQAQCYKPSATGPMPQLASYQKM